MIVSWKRFWLGYLEFNGRSTRSDYWWAILMHMIAYAVTGIFAFSGALILSGNEDSKLGLILVVVGGFTMFLYSLAIIIPTIALEVRRLQDAGFEWMYVLISLVPWIGGMIVFILNQMPTKEDQPSNNTTVK